MGVQKHFLQRELHCLLFTIQLGSTYVLNPESELYASTPAVYNERKPSFNATDYYVFAHLPVYSSAGIPQSIHIIYITLTLGIVQ